MKYQVTSSNMKSDNAQLDKTVYRKCDVFQIQFTIWDLGGSLHNSSHKHIQPWTRGFSLFIQVFLDNIPHFIMLTHPSSASFIILYFLYMCVHVFVCVCVCRITLTAGVWMVWASHLLAPVEVAAPTCCCLSWCFSPSPASWPPSHRRPPS